MYETETPTARFDFQLSSALQELVFTLTFGDETYQSLNKTYTFSTLTEEERTALTEAGIVLPEIGATEASLDFTALAAKLTGKQGETVENVITLDKVQANDRVLEGEQTYTIRTSAPEFTIAVQPENVWSKEFTIDPFTTVEGKGNATTIAANLKYQYQDESGTWQDCNDQNRHAFAAHPANKTIKVRALYREAISSNEVEIEMEAPEQLPNSNMEEWQAENIVKSIWSYYPWSSEAPSFWNTNNEYTTRYRSSVLGSAGSEAYNCFPAVSYVSGRNGGKAAELRNTAAGRGNTKFIGHTELDLNKVAGELFIGDIEVVTGGSAARPEGDHYTITKGKAFNTRPTALHFYYKYAPYNNKDTWRASIELLDENKSTIITKEVTSSEAVNGSDFDEMTITLDYEEDKVYAKCRYIYVVFSSTINTGSTLPYGTIDYTLWRDGEAIDYSDAYVGSVLTIDDLSLIYDK